MTVSHENNCSQGLPPADVSDHKLQIDAAADMEEDTGVTLPAYETDSEVLRLYALQQLFQACAFLGGLYL